MAKLAILDFMSTRLLIADVCEEQVKKLENEYSNDTESWLCEEGLDDKLEINVNSIQYMWCDDAVDIYEISI